MSMDPIRNQPTGSGNYPQSPVASPNPQTPTDPRMQELKPDNTLRSPGTSKYMQLKQIVNTFAQKIANVFTSFLDNAGKFEVTQPRASGVRNPISNNKSLIELRMNASDQLRKCEEEIARLKNEKSKIDIEACEKRLANMNAMLSNTTNPTEVQQIQKNAQSFQAMLKRS